VSVGQQRQAFGYIWLLTFLATSPRTILVVVAVLLTSGLITFADQAGTIPHWIPPTVTNHGRCRVAQSRWPYLDSLNTGGGNGLNQKINIISVCKN
jgi:hypothetical protein